MRNMLLYDVGKQLFRPENLYFLRLPGGNKQGNTRCIAIMIHDVSVCGHFAYEIGKIYVPWMLPTLDDLVSVIYARFRNRD